MSRWFGTEGTALSSAARFLQTSVKRLTGEPARTVAALGAAVLALTLVACTPGGSTSSGSPSSSPSSNSTLFAPYLYLNAPRPTLAEVADETGHRDFVLAFVLAGPGRCNPSWNGVMSVDDPSITSEVAELDENGGNVIVASGGASGPYVENACSSADGLTAAYEQALDAVGSNHLDVDVEADIPVDMVNEALATLQRDRGTTVTYTLKVQDAEQGLTSAAVELLQNAADHGLDVTVNAMVMNFGYTGNWGEAMVQAAESTVVQMREIWPEESSAELRGRLGITLMIGRNDSGMVTNLDDARLLADFARSGGIAYVGFWSVARDNGSCPGMEEVVNVCSGISQHPYEFMGIFKDLAAGRNVALPALGRRTMVLT